GLEGPAGTKVLDTGPLNAVDTLGVASRIVGIEPQEVAEPVWEEEGEHILLHHILDVASNNVHVAKPLEDVAGGIQMQILDAHTRLGSIDAVLMRGQHGIVHTGLQGCEFAIYGVGAGDVV